MKTKLGDNDDDRVFLFSRENQRLLFCVFLSLYFSLSLPLPLPLPLETLERFACLLHPFPPLFLFFLFLLLMINFKWRASMTLVLMVTSDLSFLLSLSFVAFFPLSWTNARKPQPLPGDDMTPCSSINRFIITHISLSVLWLGGSCRFLETPVNNGVVFRLSYLYL